MVGVSVGGSDVVEDPDDLLGESGIIGGDGGGAVDKEVFEAGGGVEGFGGEAREGAGVMIDGEERGLCCEVKRERGSGGEVQCWRCWGGCLGVLHRGVYERERERENGVREVNEMDRWILSVERGSFRGRMR